MVAENPAKRELQYSSAAAGHPSGGGWKCNGFLRFAGETGSDEGRTAGEKEVAVRVEKLRNAGTGVFVGRFVD